MAPRGHAALVSVGALALMAALSGCGDDETPPAPTLGGDPTTASPTPTDDTASSGAEQPFDDKGADVLRGRVNADDKAEEEVAAAWFAYWDVRLPAFNTARLDADALGEVARDQAVTEVVDYVAYLAEKGYHTEGDLKIGITEIEVHGDIAGVRACMQNKSVDRDAGGTAVEDVTPYYNHVGTLEKVGGTWLVTGKETIGSQRCKA
jgi:hypothetical protein